MLFCVKWHSCVLYTLIQFMEFARVGVDDTDAARAVVDTLIKLEDFPQAIQRLRSRDVFGKIVAKLD